MSQQKRHSKPAADLVIGAFCKLFLFSPDPDLNQKPLFVMDSEAIQTFPFLKLPAELRRSVYRHLMIFPEPIHPAPKKGVTAYIQHIRGCPLNQHKFKLRGASGHAEIRCKNRFTSNVDIISIPDSVLSLLGTCHQVLREAVHVFYRNNHFVFGGMTSTAGFVAGIGDRFLYLSELSFKFETEKAQPVFWHLARCRSLKKLHIFIDVQNSDLWTGGRGAYNRLHDQRSLHDVPALKHLLTLKGLEVLELGGFDRIACPSGYTLVEVNDPAAIGPYLREKVTAPYQEKKSKVKAKGQVISRKAKKKAEK